MRPVIKRIAITDRRKGMIAEHAEAAAHSRLRTEAPRSIRIVRHRVIGLKVIGRFRRRRYHRENGNVAGRRPGRVGDNHCVIPSCATLYIA